MMVEATRLLVTLTATAAGFIVGSRIGDESAIVGATIGAGLGYVLGGAFGRLVRRALDAAPGVIVPKVSGPQLFAGAFGIGLGVIVGLVAGFPIIYFMPPEVGWPLASLVVLLIAAFAGTVFATRADELLASFGLGARKPLATHRLGSDPESFLVDSSAAIDGRILDLARSGLARGRYWVPAFVVDELQAIADSGDQSRRRRGRRGLDVLESLRDVVGIELAILEEHVPEFPEVDAKLLAIAERSEATLVTTDHNLAAAAGVRGIGVLNPHLVADSLRPQAGAGDIIEVVVEKVGSEPGQGVGYLDDGTMVVIERAGQSVGKTVEVRVSNAVRTQMGRMLFGRLAA
ncbi:MAG: TRAM domain-containing protein [Acidimicrobiia bacterium]|nr:TRAM domain-containing protein [Acidimicrobiia bacterium]